MLTAKQKEVYVFIQKYIMAQGIAPTAQEIADAINIRSRGVVHRYVKALKEAGLITIVPKRRRNIRLALDQQATTPETQLPALPILGKIAAGAPLEVLPGYHALDVVGSMLQPNRFVLQVEGDSMVGDHICDGDFIICERRNKIKRKDIVVALLDHQEVTLKRIRYAADGTVQLLPSNPAFEVQTYPAERVEVQGVYLGLLRMESAF